MPLARARAFQPSLPLAKGVAKAALYCAHRIHARWISKDKWPAEEAAFREGKSTGSRGGILERQIMAGAEYPSASNQVQISE